jgi:hypothetical protein
MFPDSNAHHNHRIARALHHLTFLFGWLKTQLERREYNGDDESYEIVDKILTGPSIEIIKMVFVDCMNRLRSLIDANDHYVSQNITSEVLN